MGGRAFAAVLAALCLSLAALSPPTAAAPEEWVQACRVGGYGGVNLGRVGSVAVDSNDGSCWVPDTDNNRIVHLAANGDGLQEIGGFNAPFAIAINCRDSSIWVSDLRGGRVVHFTKEGGPLVAVPVTDPRGLSVDPSDGSCWVEEAGGVYQVVHLREDGSRQWQSGAGRWGNIWGYSLSVNPNDGSVWVGALSGYLLTPPAVVWGGKNEVLHLDRNGVLLSRTTDMHYPMAVSVDPSDGSCWVANYGDYVPEVGYVGGTLAHLAPDGSILSNSPGGAWSVAVNPLDGSCWVGPASGYANVSHTDESGTLIWSSFAAPSTYHWFTGCIGTAVNWRDGSAWVADDYHHQVVHLVPGVAPAANAGPDVTVLLADEGARTLQGLVTDPDVTAQCRVWCSLVDWWGAPRYWGLQYRWIDITGGGLRVLKDWTAPGPAGEATLPLGTLVPFPVGTYTLRLEAWDGQLTTSDDMVLTITTNRPPSAQAGDNLMVTSEAQAGVAIAGTAQDPDGDALTYQWNELTDAGPAVVQAWAPVADGQASLVLTSGQFATSAHLLQLEVSDGFEVARDTMVLTIQNSPPDITMIGGGTYSYGSIVSISGTLSDFDGDAIHWSISEGEAVYAEGDLTPPAGGAAVDLPVVELAGLTLGTHTLTLTADDAVNAPVSTACEVSIIDTTAPTLAPVPSVGQLWPPNHELVPVVIQVNAYDSSGGSVHIEVAAISSSEPVAGPGAGTTEPDYYVDAVEDAPAGATGGVIYLRLRAERQGQGTGRTYTISIVATDASGNQSQTTVTILAPHDKGKR